MTCLYSRGRCVQCGGTIHELKEICPSLAGSRTPQLNEPIGQPSRLEQIRNFAIAAAGHIAAGAPMASEEEIASRYAICSQCEFLVNDSCAKCGCGISRIRGYVSKLSWADQECPVGKWGKAVPPKEGATPVS